ncbi:(Fe-S)-binding protein [Kyrpidia spormannii]|uniref:Iron-sulfur oxidase subunit used in L-lactate utilization n=1 Tax=Kyrpidia spormannii TaxID=2055160 RepID=A0A6F9EES0_9BACL|nr:(Fe-S)-binding protein [Kyrpidia spormannii]CAB3394819.1 iron-sulfur oxidase subunit used in L-lactate utilization [Kyrpidia spormannii]
MRVSLFVTCLVDSLFPEVGVSTVRLLRRLGAEVDFPENQICCGQPAFNAGYHPEARAVAEGWLDAFSSSDYIVSPSGSCGGMVVHGYEELFADDPTRLAQAREVRGKVYELSQFIVEVLGLEDVGARYPARVTYHPSCHATRLMGVGDAPVRLLRRVKDLEFVELPFAEECCGFGGTFSVKMGDVSTAIVSDKIRHIQGTGADLVVGTDMGCLMNIEGRLRRIWSPVRVMHLAQLLEEGVR